MQQTTINKTISCTGIGLHSGNKVALTMLPAQANTGIVFHIATENGIKRLTPTADAVQATMLATTLGTQGASLSTVEHLLAALRGLHIDNIIIEASGGELPILDGSAAEFIEKIQATGIKKLHAPRKVLRIKAPFHIEHNQASITALPYNGFFVDYTISFPHKSIGTQHRTLDLTPHSFSEVASARTFGFIKDVEALHANGLARGGSLDNAIVLGENGVLNPEGLRYPDEFVRHKILDFIGDMAMLPLPLEGKFIVNCSGHALNNKLLRALVHDHDTYLETITLNNTKPTKTFISAMMSHSRHIGAPA